jgi:hypothetical protein
VLFFDLIMHRLQRVVSQLAPVEAKRRAIRKNLSYFRISPEVADAFANNKPVIALVWIAPIGSIGARARVFTRFSQL